MKEALDGNTLKRIRTMINKGHGTGLKIRDRTAPGLTLRVYKHTASWAVVTRTHKVTLGGLDDFRADEIPLLRELTAKVRACWADGKDPMPLIDAFQRERDVTLASHRADVSHGIGKTWEEVRDAYLAWAGNPERPQKERDTVRGYRSALGTVAGGPLERDFAPLHGKPVASITTGDLVQVRANIVERGNGGKIRQANLTVAALKACFRWYLNTPHALISTSPATELAKAPEREQSKPPASADAERTLNEDEVGLLLWALNKDRNAEKRLCLRLQLFAGQRRLTPLEAHKSAFLPHPVYGMTWRLSGDKADAWRVLPLPEQARNAVEAALALSREDSPFLFPKQRKRRAEDDMDGHLSERAVSRSIEQMRKPGGVFHDLPFDPATHDLRRSFTTIMAPRMSKYTVGNRRLSPSDVQMITHANEGRRSTASSVYDRNEYLDVKLAILEEWENICMAAYERARAKARGALQATAA